MFLIDEPIGCVQLLVHCSHWKCVFIILSLSTSLCVTCRCVRHLSLLPATLRRSFGARGRRGYHVLNNCGSEYGLSSSPVNHPGSTLLYSPILLQLSQDTLLMTPSSPHTASVILLAGRLGTSSLDWDTDSAYFWTEKN